jgi:hypothetical protein
MRVLSVRFRVNRADKSGTGLLSKTSHLNSLSAGPIQFSLEELVSNTRILGGTRDTGAAAANARNVLDKEVQEKERDRRKESRSAPK